jgi:hypothetical protein
VVVQPDSSGVDVATKAEDMGFRYQKRIRTGKNSWLNISKSGVSGSAKVGPMTFNSRGRKSIRLGNGLSYRTSGSGCAGMIALWVIAGAVVSGIVTRVF